MVKIRFFVFCLLIMLFLLGSTPALAAKYGEGKYGRGSFNQGETPTPSSGDSNSSSSSFRCDNEAPKSAPWLYSATTRGIDSIFLSFHAADDHVDHYALEFGTESGEYIWGATTIGDKNTRSYLVKSLSPNTTYYFRVRAGNGCATGPWSNEISATTNRGASFLDINKLDTEIVDVETKPLEEGQCGPYTVKAGDSLWKIVKEQLGILGEYDEIIELNKDKYPSLITNPADLNIGWELIIPCKDRGVSEKEEEVLGHSVKVKVIDENDNQVEGAKVTLYSEPKVAYTNDSGVAAFENVESGEHKLVIEYDDKKGEQNIVLGTEGAEEEFQEIALTIKIAEQNPFSSPYVIIVISVLIIGIIFLTYNNLKKKNSY